METVTAIIMDVLLVCFSVSMLTMTALGVQSFLHSRADEKRRDEAAKRDEEYHVERMKALKLGK